MSQKTSTSQKTSKKKKPDAETRESTSSESTPGGASAQNFGQVNIKKVRYSNKNGRVKVMIVYLVHPGGSLVEDEEDMNRFEVEHNDAPRPSFVDALQDLAQDVAKICEWPRAYTEGIRISSVSFSWKNEIMGASISGTKALQDTYAPLCFTTPHKPSAPYSEGGDAANCLDEECVDRLYAVMDEARKYLRGERAAKAQPSLFAMSGQ